MARKRKNSRSKGNRAEREVAKLFQNWWGGEFTRTPQSGGFATASFRDGWNASGDIVTSDVDFPFCVEVKCHENWVLDHIFTSEKTKIWSWWNQAVDESPEDKTPLLVFRRNRIPWYIMFESNTGVDLPSFKLNATCPKTNKKVIVCLLEDFFNLNDKKIFI